MLILLYPPAVCKGGIGLNCLQYQSGRFTVYVWKVSAIAVKGSPLSLDRLKYEHVVFGAEEHGHDDVHYDKGYET